MGAQEGRRLVAGLIVLLGCAARARDDETAHARTSALAYGEQAMLMPQGTAKDFGRSVALSGDVAIAGEASGDSTDTADTEIFQRAGGQWTYVESLYDLTFSRASFGTSVAVAGEIALVGSIGTISNIVGVPGRAGAAYLFLHQTIVSVPWVLLQELDAPDGAPGDAFGASVALSGGTAIVGAPWNIADGADPQGAAYVFVRQGTSPGGQWVLQQKLTASDGGPSDWFGWSVAIDGDTALVAAAGNAAYLFVRAGASASPWTQQAKLVAPGLGNAPTSDHAVAVVGDVALAGPDLFTRSGATWNAPQELMPTGYTGTIRTVALSAGTAVIANRGFAISSTAGRAFVFSHAGADPGSAWTQMGELTSPSAAANDEFGAALAISGDTVLVGATQGGTVNRGAVYAFVLGKQLGERCAAGAECLGGHCADGVCCESDCSGSCDACSRAAGGAQDGRCLPLPAGSPGSPACGALTCTGLSSTCATCSADGDCPPGQYCSPDGSCLPRKGRGDACDVSAGADCKVAGCRVCAATACADGAPATLLCTAAGRCDCSSPSRPTCDGDHTVQAPSGDVTDCTPYACEASGACRTSCTVSAQCVQGNVCHPDTGRCVPAETGPLPERSGCGCGVADGGGGAALLAAAATLLALFARGRRRRP